MTNNIHKKLSTTNKSDLKPILSLLTVSLVLFITLFATAQLSETLSQTVEILQSWHGDYPVARLDLLPDVQREQADGFITDATTFEDVWKAFQQGENIPEIDFTKNPVLYKRNTYFYNRISFAQVILKNVVTEVPAMESISAMPVTDIVGISLAVVPRNGIKDHKVGNRGGRELDIHQRSPDYGMDAEEAGVSEPRNHGY